MAISNDFPWLLFVDGVTEGLGSLVFKFCCWGTFVGEGLGFDIFGGVGNDWSVWDSFLVRSGAGSVGVTRAA